MAKKSEILAKEIIKLSDNSTWHLAKLEWSLEQVYFADEPETCLCSHFPIIEICVIKNKNNKKEAIVGNCCVKKFLGLPSNDIFSSMKKIKKDVEKSVNSATLRYAFEKNWINSWEFEFYSDIFRKRNLTDKQTRKKKQINQRILKNMSK